MKMGLDMLLADDHDDHYYYGRFFSCLLLFLTAWKYPDAEKDVA